MIARREVLGATGLAGLLGAVLPAPAAAAQQSVERAMADVATAIDMFRKNWTNERAFPELAGVREQVRAFVRATGKYPDFVDVGYDVWQGIYDWHIRWQQPIAMARDASGRYVMSVMMTTIVLRHDSTPTYISTGYDAK